MGYYNMLVVIGAVILYSQHALAVHCYFCTSYQDTCTTGDCTGSACSHGEETANGKTKITKGCIDDGGVSMFQEGCIHTEKDDKYVCKTDFCNVGSFDASCQGQIFQKAKADTVQGASNQGDGESGRNTGADLKSLLAPCALMACLLYVLPLVFA